MAEHQKTAAFHNLGCKVNAYETEAMEQLLQEAGYRIVPFEESADVYVINTCSVTNIADRKSRQMLHRARKRNPDAVVVAAGCYVQTAHDQTHLDVDADVIIGNNMKKDLAKILADYFAVRGGEDRRREDDALHILDINHDREYETLQIERSSEHTRAFIKVQDGCNQFCSYCIIPYARGRIRSRDAEDVQEEVRRLTAAGVREIVLTGIHLSSYGLEKSEQAEESSTGNDRSAFQGGRALLALIRAVSQLPGVERIRLGSLEPRIITEAFVQGLRQIPQLCPHFHLSLQSGSNTVLRRMNRRYTVEEYAHACQILREAFDEPALTTDVIVGFPGESEEEFAQAEAYLTALGLYETHIFKYSRREGTRAAAMPDQLTERVKNERSARLIALGEKNKSDYIRRWDTRPARVLFEEKVTLEGETYYTGYTREYIRVYAKCDTDLTNQVRSGRLDCTDPERVLLQPDQTENRSL